MTQVLKPSILFFIYRYYIMSKMQLTYANIEKWSQRTNFETFDRLINM